jgi:hypothetical protein
VQKGPGFLEEVMRFSALVLSAVVLSAGVSVAQTGFSTKTYPGVLPAYSDNTKLLAADFNNDGRLDLLSYGDRYVYNSAPGGYVFLNNGSGGFLAPTALAGTLPMSYAQAGDVNGDGYQDIAGCANSGSQANGYQGFQIFVYLNNGGGTFTKSVYNLPTGRCQGLTLGDVYRTGHLDIVVAAATLRTNTSASVTNQIDILKNDGSGQFTAQPSQNPVLDDPSKSVDFTNCQLIDVVGADFQQNGQFSLLLTTQCNSGMQYAPQNAGTTYLATPNAGATSGGVYTFSKVASAYDLYTNGRPFHIARGTAPSVVYTGSQPNGYGDVVYARNDGAPKFTFQSLYQGVVVGQAVGDFNLDGFPDIAVSQQSETTASPPPQITILSGTINETFTQTQTFNSGPTTALASDVVSAEFNGDGRSDLATLIYDTNSRTTGLTVFTNTLGGSGSSCSAPTTANSSVICTPANGTSVSSPVSVTAASNVTGFTLNRLYLDNQSVYLTASQTVSTSLTIGGGSHRLVLVSYNNTGQAFSSASTFTVGSGGCSQSAAGATICAPAAGSTANSPVTITAAAKASAGNITAVRAYIDGNVAFTVNNSAAANYQQVSQSVTVAAGSHNLVIIGYQSNGGYVKASANFTVSGSTPCYPSSAGASICSPSNGSTTSSPFNLTAGATARSGYITAVRVYVDSIAKTLVNNPQQSRSFAINPSISEAAGKHSIVVVGYQSTGGSVSASSTATVQ